MLLIMKVAALNTDDMDFLQDHPLRTLTKLLFSQASWPKKTKKGQKHAGARLQNRSQRCILIRLDLKSQ